MRTIYILGVAILLGITVYLSISLFFKTEDKKEFSTKETLMLNVLKGKGISNISDLKVSFDSMIVIDYQDKISNISVKDILDTAFHVNLEFNKDALFSSISEVEVKDSIILVFGTRSIGEYVLSIFSSSGKFIRNIGNVGKGPKEYIKLSGYEIYKNNIYLFDDGRTGILKFDINGNHIRSYRLPFRFQDMKYLNDSLILFNPSPYNNHLPEIQGYDIIVTDTCFVPLKRAFYTNRAKRKLTFGVGSSYFSRYKASIYFHPLFSDTIYSINNKCELKAFVSYKFGKHQLTSNEKNKDDKEFIRYITDRDKIFIYHNIIITENYIITKLVFCKPEKKGIILYNKKSATQKYFSPFQLKFNSSFIATPLNVMNMAGYVSDNVLITHDNCNIRAFDEKSQQFLLKTLNKNTKESFLRETDVNDIISFLKYK